MQILYKQEVSVNNLITEISFHGQQHFQDYIY